MDKLDTILQHPRDQITEIIKRIYDIETDDRLIREAAVSDEIDRARNFDVLRKNYRVRREFMNTEVTLQNVSDSLRRKVKAMGFVISET